MRPTLAACMAGVRKTMAMVSQSVGVGGERNLCKSQHVGEHSVGKVEGAEVVLRYRWAGTGVRRDKGSSRQTRCLWGWASSARDWYTVPLPASSGTSTRAEDNMEGTSTQTQIQIQSQPKLNITNQYPRLQIITIIYSHPPLAIYSKPGNHATLWLDGDAMQCDAMQPRLRKAGISHHSCANREAEQILHDGLSSMPSRPAKNIDRSTSNASSADAWRHAVAHEPS